jgi:hypothetical protein
VVVVSFPWRRTSMEALRAPLSLLLWKISKVLKMRYLDSRIFSKTKSGVFIEVEG